MQDAKKLNKQAYEQLDMNPLETVNLAKKAEALAEENEDYFEYAYSKFLQGWANIHTGYFLDAVIELNLAKELFLKLKNIKYYTIVLNKMGSLYFRIGNMEEALKLTQKAFTLAERNRDGDQQISTLQHLAGIYFEMGEETKAVLFLQEEGEKMILQSQDSKKKVALYLNIAYMLLSLKKNVEAKNYIDKAQELMNKIDSNLLVAEMNRIKAMFLFNESNFAEAKSFALQSLYFAKEINNINAILGLLYTLGDIYRKTREFDKAQKFFEESLEIAEKNYSLLFQLKALKKLSGLSMTMKNAELAKEYNQKIIQLEKTIYDFNIKIAMEVFRANSFAKNFILKRKPDEKEYNIDFDDKDNEILFYDDILLIREFFQILEKKANLEKFIKELYLFFARYFKAECFELGIVKGNGSYMDVIYSVIDKEEQNPYSLSFKQKKNIYSLIYREFEPLLIENYQSEYPYKTVSPNKNEESAIGSCVYYPMKRENEKFCILYLSSKNQYQFSKKTLLLLSFFSSGIALSLQLSLDRIMLESIKKSMVPSYENELQPFKDTITGFYRKESIEEVSSFFLSICSREKNITALSVLELCHIDEINEEMGYHIGNRIIAKIASIIKKNIRNSDIVFHSESNSFIFLTMHKNKINITDFLKKIEKILSGNITLLGRAYSILYYMGVSIYPDNGANTADLLKKAHSALEKLRGNNEKGINVYKD